VDDPTATSLTQTGLQAGELVAVAVASLDGTGNVGPLSTSSCATVEEGEADPSKPTTVTAGCGCEAAGATAAESLASGLLALGAMGVTVARRRRRTSPVQG
jgi:MYXO-CTERM domain-containing protein